MFEKVLIVDDEKHVVEAISAYLGKLQISSRIEMDPKSAINSFPENPADVVIVDFKFASLSGKTGLDIIDSVRKHKPTTRFILISGLIPNMEDPEIQDQLLKQVQVDYNFSKPVNPVQLGKAVQDLLNRAVADSSDWESIAKNYVTKSEISSTEVRKINEKYKDAILKSLEEQD